MARQDYPLVATVAGTQLLRSGDWLRAVVAAWEPGAYRAGELVYDAGILFRTKVAIANSQAAPSTYNSGQFFEQLTRADALVSVALNGSTLTFTRANGEQLFIDLPSGGAGGSTPPGPEAAGTTNIFLVSDAKRQAVIAANVAAYVEPDASFAGQEFYDEVNRTGKVVHYRCGQSVQANGSTVVKWFRNTLNPTL